MDKCRNNYCDGKYNKEKGKVIPMPAVKDLPVREQEKSQVGTSQVKKSKREIAREIADQVGVYGKAFGRNMREHHKQGR